MATQVQTTIINQVKSNGVNIKGYKLVTMGSNAVRFHKPSRKIGGDFKSIDIEYNSGTDTYNVTIHKGGGKLPIGKIKSTHHNDIYNEDLKQFFK